MPHLGSHRLLAFAAVMVAGAASPAAAQLLPSNPPVEPGQTNLFFDYFLFDNGGQPAQDFNGFFLWTVTNGTVDLEGPGLVSVPPGGTLPVNLEGRFVDLGGSSGDPGLFETRRDFAVTTADTYRLRFRYRSTGGGDDAASVSLGDLRFNVATNSTEFQQFDQTFRFTDLQLLGVAGLVRLGFQGSEVGVDASNIAIDSVLFDQLLPALPGGGAGAVPEPRSWATMALGFGLVGAAIRRRPRARRTAR